MSRLDVFFRTGWVWAAVAFLAGCAGRGVLQPSLPLTQLHLLSMPMTVNMDGAPGADGFACRIYGGNPNSAKPLPIREGILEVLMFDGIVTQGGTNNPTLHAWRFPADELKTFEIESSIGFGYNLKLRWGTDQPQKDHVSVVARYQAQTGSVIYSTPSYLTVVSP